ncbi:hypothetical protein HZB00_01395 [Candidatus Woesearchaeota archaeon]|nr:hypothetical protein [Candidatus Woesearchaeota archaeon]
MENAQQRYQVEFKVCQEDPNRYSTEKNVIEADSDDNAFERAYLKANQIAYESGEEKTRVVLQMKKGERSVNLQELMARIMLARGRTMDRLENIFPTPETFVLEKTQRR